MSRIFGGACFGCKDMRGTTPRGTTPLQDAEGPILFWRVQIAAWLMLAALGFCIRYVAYGSAMVAWVLTLLMDTLGFGLTSTAALLHARHPGANRVQTAICAALLCVGASALMAK